MADTGAGVPKRFRTKEQMRTRRDSDRARAKTRVTLGNVFKRWRELRQSKGMKSDTELALFLLNRAGAALSTPSEGKHQTVVGVDETELGDPVAVQDEDDLTGKRACIAYEECLRKLGTFLQLPIQTCPHVDPITKTKCSCCSPFQVEISRSGTAFMMEWCCSNGHSLWKWNSQPLLKFGMQSGDLMLSSSILHSGNSYTKVGLLFKHMNMGMVVDTTLHSIQDTSMKDFWQKKRAEVLARLKEKDSGTVLEFPANIQQLQMKEEPSWQQESSYSLQEDTEPQNIEEGQDEFLGTVQDREQLQGLEEADTNTFPFNVVAVKSEEDEERPHLLQLNQRQTDQMKTGLNEEDCGGPEADRSSHLETYSPPEIEVKLEDSSETETDDSEIYSCSECGKRFNRKPDLRAHMLHHSKLKPLSCSECGKKYSDKTRLTRHLKIHFGGKPFSCSECGKQFKHQHILNIHMMIHTGEKPFSCSECGRRFNQKSNLTRHIMSHTGENALTCSECGQQFKHESALARHMRIHTGERPFSCSVCRKTFKQQAHLTSHMHVHREEKPYSCSECGKKFYCKWHLTSHMLVHTGEKPFSCSECGKRFYRKWHLTSHMLVHTTGGENLDSCSVHD